MARFRGTVALPPGTPRTTERQLTLAERLDGITRLAEVHDPRRAALGIFAVVLALVGLGLLVQVGHASTTLDPDAFRAELLQLFAFRITGIAILLLAYRVGPDGVRRFVPALAALAIVLLLAVYVPGLSAVANGSRRWIHVPGSGSTLQPSEFARVVAVLWVASRCARLGPLVRDGRRGYLPMLGLGLALFVAVLAQPDLGGALLFLLCFLCTMWVGGARPTHVAGSLGTAAVGALLLAVSSYAHVRERLAVWVGDSSNTQVLHASEAMASGDLWGVGLTHGGWRNHGLQYMQTDYVFSLVGEELGFFGQCVVVGLLLAFAWHSLRLVLSIRDRYRALAAFGLLMSVALQAMLHVQVVTGLAPPKGMNLPFVSDGGSSLFASCAAVGLALGAVRARESSS